MLKQDAITPLYIQLMNEVEDMIRSGVYRSGDKILTEREIAEKYGVSIITVRKAMGALMEKGLIVRRQGKGTFVTQTKFHKNMKKLQSFTEMCGQIGVTPGARVLEKRLAAADKKTAKQLGVAPGSSVVYISRLRLADGEPVQIEKSYFPMKYAFLLDENLDDSSLFECLKEKAGVRVSSSEKVIEMSKVTLEEAAYMHMKKGDYLLYVRSTAYDENREPLYVGIQLINGDRFSLYVYESDE